MKRKERRMIIIIHDRWSVFIMKVKSNVGSASRNKKRTNEEEGEVAEEA